MKNRNRLVLIGLVALAAIGFFTLRGKFQDSPKPSLSDEEVLQQTEDRIEDTFNTHIPDSAERAVLSAEEGIDGTGLVTREERDGSYAYTVLVDLPAPVGSYVVWTGSEEDVVRHGTLRVAKGGYLLDFISSDELSSFIISDEIGQTATPTAIVLQGSL